MRAVLRTSAVALAVMLAGCAEKGGQAEAERSEAERSEAEASAPPATTGKVIEVKLITDDTGNRFEPNDIEADPGDVIRLTLVSGVHNLSFPADKNPGKSGLPEATPMLQLPGQTHDIQLSMAPGHYAFQCDPHAALGMTGTLEIEDD